MLKNYARVAGALVMMLFLCQALQAQPNQGPEAPSKKYFISDGRRVNIDSFNSNIEKVMEDWKIPGLSLAVIEDNKIAYFQVYGYKDILKKTKVDSNTLFEACSLSKMFLLFAAYKMVDQGLLDLDKPMYQYLPNPDLEHDPRYKLITVRMILSHTSGLENWKHENNSEVLEIIKDPGTEVTYSGEGYHYLAKVMAALLKKPYSQYIREMVLNPLHLQQTTLNYTEADSSGDYAKGHTLLDWPFNKYIIREPWPASYLNTNALEFSRLLIGLFDGHLTENSIRKLKDTVKSLRKDSLSGYYITNGFFLITSPQDTIINFGGNNDGFKADLLYSVVHKRGFVFFSNCDLGILPGSAINQLTAGLDAQFYFNSPDFNRMRDLGLLIMTYKNQGGPALLQEMSKRMNADPDLEALEELMFQIHWSDKETAGAMADMILKKNTQSAYSNAILGIVYVEKNHNYTLGKQYLTRAKELKFGRIDIDGYLKTCDTELSKTNK